ncbi:MAG: enoyl-CoA hydratase/isomerase family protein [Pseudomonadota bacterium]|nr:enoyl-CoA hydratase/isomerase family protein [Pseudomonadota bacterium]
MKAPAAPRQRAQVRLEMGRDARAGVAMLTLARSTTGNALVPDLLLDLCVALEAIARREDVRAVVLAAEGENFSLGDDMQRFVAEMRGPGLQTYSAELVGLLNQSILALLRLPQPVVAAVDGPVVGGSLGLVLACDVVVASERAVFRAHHARAGFAPDGGWTALLPRVVGVRRAAAGFLLDREISAAEACDWGIATVLVPAGAALAEATGAAQRIAAAPVATMRAGKRLLHADLGPIEAALEAERVAFVAEVGGPEARACVPRLLAEIDPQPGSPG